MSSLADYFEIKEDIFDRIADELGLKVIKSETFGDFIESSLKDFNLMERELILRGWILHGFILNITKKLNSTK